MLSKKKVISFLILCGYISIPLVLLVLPANFFDDGETICLSRMLLDRDCPGCGLTRGTQHFIHLDFSVAWEYNKLTFLVFPIFAFFWAKWAWSEWKNYKNLKD